MLNKDKENPQTKNQEFNLKAKEIKDKQTTRQYIKRPGRKPKAEVEAEQVKAELKDDGYDLIADFIKMISDNDARRYSLPKMPKEEFYPLAKNYARIINYFLPKAKPIYFVISATAFQTFAMIRNRYILINEAIEKNPDLAKPKKEETPPPVLPITNTSEFPKEKDLTLRKV